MKKYDTIFLRIIALTIPTILVVSTIISFSCLKISEKLLLNEMIEIGKTNLAIIQTELLEYNTKLATTISKITGSSEFKNYTTLPTDSQLDQLNLIMDIGKYMDMYREYLTPPNSYFIVSSTNPEINRYYSSNAWKWDQIPDDFVETYMTIDGKIPNRIIYHFDQNSFSKTSPYQHNILVTRPLFDQKGELYSFIILVIDESYIASMYQSYLTNGMKISMVARDGLVLSSSDKTLLNTRNSEFLSLIESIPIENMQSLNLIHSGQNTTLSSYLPFYDAYLIEEIDQAIVFSSLYTLGDYMIIIVLIIMVVTSILIFIISKFITNPLSYLAKNMTFAATHEFKCPAIDVRGSSEVALMTRAYNTMLEDINHHVQNLLAEQEQRRKAELSALQMQINPHFLYNTLSSIKYLAKQQKIEQVDETINSLISILQNVIGTPDEMTTIKEEIKNLGFYVYINQVRYGEGIKVNYEISDDCYDLTIPKLIIQPFIENAFFHGFAGLDSGNITVFINRYSEVLLIEIIDNGVGMENSDEVASQKKYHFTGIGINNVDERIKILYGNLYGIEVQSEVGSGTSIMIRLPAICDASLIK